MLLSPRILEYIAAYYFNGAGYPRFQGRNRYNSFTYPQAGYSIKDNKLTLSKIGNIKIVLHREIEGKIKTCTIKKNVDYWYVSFSCQIDIPIEPVEIKTITGIVFEKLQIQNMLKNHCLAKSIVDASWSQFNYLQSRIRW